MKFCLFPRNINRANKALLAVGASDLVNIDGGMTMGAGDQGKEGVDPEQHVTAHASDYGTGSLMFRPRYQECHAQEVSQKAR